jgi:hypothetical protein
MPSAHVSSTGCDTGACKVVSCTSGWGDCDGSFANGCDKNLMTDSQYCGTCATDCTDEIGNNNISGVVCDTGTCEVDACTGARADCDAAFSNGCEINTSNNVNHCGACNPGANNPGSGQNCAASVGSNNISAVQCDTGACEVTACSAANRKDCDGDFDNGCETNISTDNTHCGGCAGSGGETCGPKPNASGSCSNGDCNYTCNSGWLDVDGDKNVDVGSNGCETRKLEVVNSSAYGSQDTASSTAHLTFTHTLQKASNTQRLLLVGIMCRGNNQTRCLLTTAKYGTADLTLLGQSSTSNNSVAEIYYALDATLPGAGTYTVDLRNDAQGWGAITAQVIELNGAAQTSFAAAVGGATNGNSCSAGSPDTTVALSSLPNGSAIYAVGGGFSGSAGTSSVSAPLMASLSSIDQNGILFGSGLASQISGTQNATMNFNGCNASAMYAVGVRPESN